MTGLDPDLAEQIRRSADARIAEQIQAAGRRADSQKETRAAFASRRGAGVRSRNAARQARLRMIANHQAEETP